MRSPNINDVTARTNRVIGLYARAHGEIDGILGDTQAVTNGKQRGSLTARMRKVITQLGEARDPQVHGLVRLAYARGLHLVDPDAKFTVVDDQKSTILEKSLAERLFAAEALVVRSFTDAIRRTKLRTSALAMQKSQDTGGALASMLQPTGYLDRSGRRWGLLQYAEMAVRTVAHEALSEATVSCMHTHGLNVVKVSENQPSTSAACEPYDGRTFSITADNPDWPTIDKLPPFHSACEHFIYSVELA